MIVRVLILGLLLSPAAVFGAEFLDLGWGGNLNDMTPDGSALVARTRDTPSNPSFGAVWSAEDGFTLAGDSWFQGITADGKTAVGSDAGSPPFQPYIWDLETGPRSFSIPAEFDGGTIFDISADGSFFSGRLQNFDDNGSTTRQSAFRWSEDFGFQFFDKPSDVRFQNAQHISADGSTVLVRDTFEGDDFFSVWNDGTGSTDRIPVGNSFFNLSSDGTTVVGRTLAEDGQEAFRWTLDSGIVGLGYLPGDDISRAFGVNNDGSLLVGQSNVSNPETGGPRGGISGFVWDEVRGMRDLETALETEHGLAIPDSYFFYGSLVSDDGRTIAGRMDPTSRSGGKIWMAKLDRPIHWIPGDTDHDSDVDFADFLALSNSFGMNGTWENGDFDLNGNVEFNDFLALSENFGISPVASQHAVPESSAANLALPLLILAIQRFRRNRKHI